MGQENGFGPRIIAENLFGIKDIFGLRFVITDTVVNTWIIMFIILVFGITVRVSLKNFKKFPGKFQNVIELLVEGINTLVKMSMGEKRLFFAPYFGSLALYLLIANLWGLTGLKPPTSDLNTTLGLAVITFVLTQFYGIRSKGLLGYIKGFFQPIPFLFPINVIGELANPVSLSFRLFGNILGGFIIMGLLYQIPVIRLIIPIPLHMYFDIFAGVLQTYIFVMLSMTFVTLAME